MLNIAKQIYAGWNTGPIPSGLPEAEVIPIGSTGNEKRRLEAVKKKYKTLKEESNVPLPGFTLYKTSRKNWGSADPTWLVIDPRGYLVRITNNNLEDILHVTGITEGLIQEKCVWARDDSQTKMTLVPISSPDYQTATKNTELIESKVVLKDVQIGDTVLLQNELTGIYMGVASLYSTIESYSEIRKPQVFLRRQIIKSVDVANYYYQADLKILKVTEKTDAPMTKEESVAEMNKDIESGAAYFTNTPHFSSTGYYSSRGMIRHVSTNAVPKLTMSLKEITLAEAKDKLEEAYSDVDSGILVIEDDKGKKYVINFPYSKAIAAVDPTKLDITQIEEFQDMCENFRVKKVDRGYYSYGSYSATVYHNLDTFKKFYIIVKHVKNSSYV